MRRIGGGGGGGSEFETPRAALGGSDKFGRARPRRQKHVDIDLVRAPFDEVARLLSDAGHFNVVVEAPGASPVTVKLRDVDPFEALEVIAHVRGLEISMRSGMVVIAPANSKTARND